MSTDPLLTSWDNFYVIIGSGGAALIGLQFVVITLLAGMRKRVAADTINSFGTPTVVHLAEALLVSAIMSAPWQSSLPASIALVICGLGGLAYCSIVFRRTRRQTDYAPVGEDWFWYSIVPAVIYTALTLSALFLQAAQIAPYIIGAAALGLLLAGIRNAWDTVIHMVTSDFLDDATTGGRRPGPRSLEEAALDIKKSGSQPTGPGPEEYFTGMVSIDPLFQAPEPARAVGASVTFEPGARTAWHTHPLGQTLIVTAGLGLAQRWGGTIEEIRPGDVIWFPPGEKHWHGASASTAMTHIAIQERLDGKTVDWLEKVSDEQYGARALTK